MSGLAGVWNLDGRPVDPAILDALASSLAHPACDQRGEWSEGPIGFISRRLRVTPESRDDIQPAVDRLGNVLVFDGRLDNRRELLQSLPIGTERNAIADAALILEAWRRWGSDCLRRLAGEFALALFDACERTLVLARDPVGCRPLYYRDDGQRLVFGSEIKAIAAHPGVRLEPNENLLADFFALDQLPYDDTGETFFADVFAVLPGWMLRVSAAGRQSAQFWDFDPRAQLRYRTHTEYAERLRELLTQAVRRRLRSDYPVAIAASGGLDSSAVLCLADEVRKREGAGAPLLPTTCVLAAGAIAGDRPIELDRLEAARGVVIDRIPAAAAGDLRDAEATAWQSEWPRFDDGWCALRPMFQHAHARGARVLLTGQWSDQLLFVTGYLSDLFMTGSWRQVARHLDEYTRWYPDADPRYFRRRFQHQLLLDIVPETVRARVRPVWRRLTKSGGPPCLESGLVRRAARPRPRVFRPHCASAHARNIYQSVRHMSHRLQFEADHKLAASCGIEITTPFLDRDVIQYLMSIPGEVQNRGGVPRALLRDAMRGIVPDEILGRRWHDEGSTVARRHAYLGTSTNLSASHALGLVCDARTIDQESLDLLGLEFWSRAFFSDRLTLPQHSQLSPHSLQGAVKLWTTQPRRIRMAAKSSPTRLRS